MEDDQIETFMMVTGVASQDIARGYLQISGGEAMQAIQVFYDNPELQSSFAAPSAPTAPATSSSRPGNSGHGNRADTSDVIEIESDDDDDMLVADDNSDHEDVAAVARNAQEEEDAAMARRLQEELYGSGSGTADDGVRAPIAQTTETLAGPNMSWGPIDIDHEDELRARRARQQRRSGLVPAVVSFIC